MVPPGFTGINLPQLPAAVMLLFMVFILLNCEALKLQNPNQAFEVCQTTLLMVLSAIALGPILSLTISSCPSTGPQASAKILSISKHFVGKGPLLLPPGQVCAFKILKLIEKRIRKIILLNIALNKACKTNFPTLSKCKVTKN